MFLKQSQKVKSSQVFFAPDLSLPLLLCEVFFRSRLIHAKTLKKLVPWLAGWASARTASSHLFMLMYGTEVRFWFGLVVRTTSTLPGLSAGCGVNEPLRLIKRIEV